MKAIVFRLSQGSDKQFEIGENADKNVIGYFAEMYAGWNSWDIEETESSIEAVMAFLHNAQHGTYAREYDLHDPKEVAAFWEDVEVEDCEYDAFNELAHLDARDSSDLLKTALRKDQYSRYEWEIDKRPHVTRKEFDFIMTGDYRILDEDEE